jgi:heptosyltransferase-3
MKILVLQLARLGDVYQSWPALRALRRLYPSAQIDVMVRPKFADALDGLECISDRILLPVNALFEPLLKPIPEIESSIASLDQFITGLKRARYDWVINFSFSPVSSYLVHAIKNLPAQATGYTRHDDGFFDMSGEISAYFYAQVGINRQNRFHVTDLLAGLIGVELEADDWKDPGTTNDKLKLPDQYIVMHIGASETQKSLPPFKWSRIIKFFHEENPGTAIVLIGAQGEKLIADLVMAGRGDASVINLVGETSVQDLFPVLRDSALLIGCDSAPMHIASFTKTPCLNISLGQVNFWETGPRSPRSYIFRAVSAEDIVSEYIGHMAKEIIEGKDPQGLAKYVPESPCYQLEESSEQRFCWDLILALYMGHPFPQTEDMRYFQGCQKLNEINDVIIEQLKLVTKAGLEKLKPILDRGDEVIHTLGGMIPEMKIYTNWLKAERARVKPGSVAEVVEATLKMHMTLKSLVKPYVLDDSQAQQGGKNG